MRKKILVPGLLAGLVLLILSYGLLSLMILLLPQIAEEYFNPAFRSGDAYGPLFFLHPFVLSIALAWFWDRFKSLFRGSFVLRGAEMGVVYGLVATLPSMWMTFSAMDVSLTLVISWLLYGVAQAIIAGIIYAKMNP